jgi:ABC-2 type transport system ATP-binding protein
VTVAELDAVEKRYGDVRALDGASLTVAEGELVAVLGPNGAGKSTALRVLLGLARPDAGSATLFGGDPRRAAARARVGVAPQESQFPGTLRVRELLALARAHFAQSLPLDELAARFGLERLLARQAGGLSGGERRRVGVALAFAGNPRLVVLDEPTTGLDLEARDAVWAAIDEHARGGGTLLLTTHQLAEADALARRIVLLEHGRVVADAAPDAIKQSAGLTAVSYRDECGRRRTLLTRDGGCTVEELVAGGVRLRELEVRPLTLEEALAARAST